MYCKLALCIVRSNSAAVMWKKEKLDLSKVPRFGTQASQFTEQRHKISIQRLSSSPRQLLLPGERYLQVFKNISLW